MTWFFFSVSENRILFVGFSMSASLVKQEWFGELANNIITLTAACQVMLLETSLKMMLNPSRARCMSIYCHLFESLASALQSSFCCEPFWLGHWDIYHRAMLPVLVFDIDCSWTIVHFPILLRKKFTLERAGKLFQSQTKTSCLHFCLLH